MENVRSEFSEQTWPVDGDKFTLEMAEKTCFFATSFLIEMIDDKVLRGEFAEPEVAMTNLLRGLMCELASLSNRWGADQKLMDLQAKEMS